jgi:ribosomal protein L18
MGLKFANNAFGTLSAGITNSATSITLSSGQGARFPTLAVGDYFYATLIDTSNNLEIVKVTARSTDVLTATRAQDNTTARAFAIGDRIELRITAATLEEVVSGATVLTDQSPQLGGNLDLNSQDITGTGNIDITGDIDASSEFKIGGTVLADSDGIHVPQLSSNPSSPVEGQMYYNTTNKVIYNWDGSQWLQMSNKFTGSGGTESTSGGYKFHLFTTSGTFVADTAGIIDVLIIAGGGGGGGWGGGGGAGGLVDATSASISAGSYSIVVGAGGSAGYYAPPYVAGGDGNPSSALGQTQAVGGGGGGAFDSNPGRAGGSGGGASIRSTTGTTLGGSGTSGQGNAGGSCSPTVANTNPYPRGGGGGGAGSAGFLSNGGAGTQGDGGFGLSKSNYSQFGASGVFAGGGGGHTDGRASPFVGTNTSGGAGGGGNGGRYVTGTGSSDLNATAGSTNTGGGGGGAYGANSSLAAAGGSGVVIIRYIE